MAPPTCASFGSAARGDQDASDLDLLVEKGEDQSLFDLIALFEELGETLDRCYQ